MTLTRGNPPEPTAAAAAMASGEPTERGGDDQADPGR